MSHVLLGAESVTFAFPSDQDKHESTPTVIKSLTPPKGTQLVSILLQGWSLRYSNGKQYGFSELGVMLSTVVQASKMDAVCVATLKDDKLDHKDRDWTGSVVGVVQFYGPATA
ncbi:MAG: hypothetical protein M3O15_07940 [Acidobacteriota bacterium]|nr:hypothetical protein [Acidobacteriota bacterium]